jgi:hypothetical protein
LENLSHFVVFTQKQKLCTLTDFPKIMGKSNKIRDNTTHTACQETIVMLADCLSVLGSWDKGEVSADVL